MSGPNLFQRLWCVLFHRAQHDCHGAGDWWFTTCRKCGHAWNEPR